MGKAMFGLGLLAKRARLFFEMLAVRNFHVRRPLIAFVMLTYRCNMRCRYCFVDGAGKSVELTDSQWLSLIDELASRGTRQVYLMGGEPLIHPGFEAIVERIKGHGMICDVITNGLLIPQKMQVLAKLDSLVISLDGQSQANDANRIMPNGVGSFDKVKPNIEKALHAGIPVRINAVLTRQNINDIEFLLDLADQHDLYVTFTTMDPVPWHSPDQAKEIMLTTEQTREVYKRIRKLKAEGRRVLYSLPTLDYIIGYPLPYDQIILKSDKEHATYSSHSCPHGKAMLCIDANGDCYPCPGLWNTNIFKPYNLIQDGFPKAWDHMKELKCQTCSCMAVPEWNQVTSLAGITHGIRLTLNQLLVKRKSN